MKNSLQLRLGAATTKNDFAAKTTKTFKNPPSTRSRFNIFKFLSAFALVMLLGVNVKVNAQIAISGYMANPAGNDDKYEYVQLIATQDINFATTNYVVLMCNNGTALSTGWTNCGAVVYRFNLTSGSVTAGSVFYVGGDGKLINGASTTDISGATWIRAINTNTTGGDGTCGNSGGTSGIMGNGGANADGIAVFNTTTITSTTVPIDAIFYGTGVGTAKPVSGGYYIPTNDVYTQSTSSSTTYGNTGNATFFTDAGSGIFVKLTGTYNTGSSSWTVTRVASSVSTPTTLSNIATGITIVSPSVALSSPTIPSSNLTASSTNNIIGAVQLDVTLANATLNGVTFTTSGTYTATDIATNGFKFWLSSSATDISSATQLGAAQAAATNGSSISVSGLSNSITSGTTRYIVLSANIAASPTNGVTIGIGSTAHSNITFASGAKTGTNPVAAGSTRIIGGSTAPTAPTMGTITPGNQTLSVAFTAGSDGGSALTSYKYSTDGGTSFLTRQTGTTASPIVITTLSSDGTTALTNGTSYNIQIKAVNGIGDGTATGSTAAVPYTAPSAPSIIGITAGNTQLSVAFTAGGTGGSAITNYKYSIDNGSTFTAVSPAATTSPILITGLTNGVSYQVQIKAVNAIGDGAATASTSRTPLLSYCTPSGSTAATTYVSNFTTTSGVTNLNNTSTYSASGYGNFTAQSASQYPNTAINWSLTLVGGTAGIAIWVDWNNNGVFTDSGENVYNSAAYIATGTWTGSFTVPVSQATGNYRMRAIVDFNGSTPSSCVAATTAAGEAEDYTFTVVAATPAVFYSKSTGNLDVLGTWGSNTDGTGTNPADFTTAGKTYNIRNNVIPTIGAAWAVSGTSSKVVTGDGATGVNFTIPSGFAFTGTIDVSAASTLTIANTTIPTFGTLAATSTVDYAGTTQTIAAVNYGNLSNSSNGTRTLASTGTIGVAGTYTPTSGTNTISGSTINYNGTAAQTVSASTYNNLTVSNAAGSTTGGNVTVNGTLLASENFTVGDSSTLTINSTGSVTIASAKNLTVNATGTIQNNSVTGFTVTGTMTVNGTYVHNANSNTLPSTNTTYATGSTIKVGDGGANITSTIPLIPTSAYNVIWNCPSQTAGANFISSTPININNLTISSTGTGFITNGFSTTARTLNIAGNLSVSGGNYYIVANNATSATANQTTNVTGNVTVSGGQLGISYNTGGTGLGYLNVDGNILHTAGTFGNQSASTIGTLTCKGSVLQDIQTTGVSNNIALTINNASGVSLNSSLTIGGLLTLSSGSFSVGSNTLTLNGAAIAGTPANLSTSSSSSLSFGGSAGSTIIPSSVTALNNLTINNSNGVALNSSLVISGTLTFTSGNLTIGSNTLTLNGAVVNTSGTLTGSATSNLTIGGAAGTLNFTSGGRSLNNLSLGASGVATLGSALDIYGVLGFTAGGNLNMGAQAVTLKSTTTATARVSDLTGSTLSGATNVTVERYIPAKRAWRALTAPLKGSSVDASIFSQWQNNGATVANTGVELWGPGGTGSAGNGLAVGPNSSILQYVSGAWSGVTNTNTTNLFTTNGNNAFMVFPTGGYGSNLIASNTSAVATTLKATGQLITGDVPYASLPSASHTLIGNPYASPLSLTAMLLDNLSFVQNIWIWDANVSGTNAVGTFNLFAFGTYTNLTSNILVTSGTQIQSGQAFFVLPTVNLSTFTIKETHKGSAFSNAVLRTATPELLRVGLYKQINTEWSGRDGAMTVITPDADANQMPNKMANGTENVAFTKNSGLFASNHHLPLIASDVLNVKVWNTTAGTNYKLKIYTEEFTATNLDATLEDVFTNARTPLPLDGTAVDYPFAVTTDALSTGNRFRIVFQTSALGINNPKANGFSIIPNPVTGDAFQVNLGSLATGTYSYTICNALGQEVEKGSINNAAQNTNYEVKMSNGAAGIYIMKIKGSDNSVFSAKIIKK